VSGVLDGHLKDREYLVGDKCTYADLAFVTWQVGIKRVVGEFDWEGEFPCMSAWLERMVEREAVSKVLKEKEGLEKEMMAKADREGRNPFAVRKDE
jgi:glutathione S-transferase